MLQIADYCRTIPPFQDEEAKRRTFLGNVTALEVYRLMIIKVAKAPLKIPTDATVILYLLIIAEKLQTANTAVAT